jgi:hypothetical protein
MLRDTVVTCRVLYLEGFSITNHELAERNIPLSCTRNR